MSPSVKIFAEKQENIFRANLHDFRLKTHKLAGRLRDYWAFSIGRDYRIIFSFVEKNRVRFHAIGRHDIYERFF